MPVVEDVFWKSVIKSIWVGGITVALLTEGKIQWEETNLGRHIDHLIYGAVQRWLLPKPDPKDKLPVTVVDISDLTEEVPSATPENDDGSSGKHIAITPRQPLIELIKAIAKEGPCAIGLDLNMAPEADRPKLSVKDRELLGLMQALGTPDHERNSKPIKCVVAVGDRSQYLEPEDWLGDAAYYELAGTASILVKDPRCLPWLLRKRGVDNDSSESVLYSLSAQLALGGGAKSLDHAGHWFSYLHETIPESPHDNLWVDECYWVDYSSLNRLRHEALLGFEPAMIASAKEKIANKVVLIGRIARLDDGSLPRAGVDDYDVIPGVLTHACGVLTLLRGGLIQPTHHARLISDVVLSALAILTVQGVRTMYRKKKGAKVNIHGTHGLVTWAAIIVVVVAGIVLAAFFRVVWTDPPLIAVAMLLHDKLENLLLAIPRAVKDIIVRCIFSKLGDDHAH
ncbi:MAG: CHASE2 domain-containing protein [Prosthecobacter sp.]